MRKPAHLLILVAIVFLLPATDMSGCGDKYLSVGRGSRYQRGYVSIRPVSIAVLKHAATAQKDFLARLKMAGHRIEIADTVEKLTARLAASKFDVVLADYADAAEVNRSMHTMSSRPLFLPVVDAGSPHVAAAHREYGCHLSGNSKSKSHNFLAVLDEAVESNRKSKPLKCDLPKA